MTDLPPGWVTAVVGDLGLEGEQTVMTGPFGSHMRASEFSASGVPVLTIGCLTEHGISLSKANYLAETKAEPLARYRLRTGDMLFSRMASVGRAGFVTKGLDGVLFNYHLMRLRLDPKLYEPELFLAFVRGAPQVRKYLEDVNHGATRDGINTEQLLAMPVLVPPRSEQRRIVAKLRAILEQTRAAKARLDRLPAQLDKLKRSILAAAFRGELTADWRAAHPNVENASARLHDLRAERREAATKASYKEPHAIDPTEMPPLPGGWIWASIAELCTRIVDCPHSTPRWSDGSTGYRCVRTTEFRPGSLDIERARFVTRATYVERTSRLVPQVGDVLYSREGGILGVACAVPEGDPVCLGQRMMLMRVSSLIPQAWLVHWLNAPFIAARVAELITGTASPHLNVRDVTAFPVPLPPRAELDRILKLLEAADLATGHLIRRQQDAISKVGLLEEAALAKAFRGELVEQDPSDEPVSALLDSVRRMSSTETADSRKAERKARRRTRRQEESRT